MADSGSQIVYFPMKKTLKLQTKILENFLLALKSERT